jgi:quinol monooxygenase YgiN
MMIGTHSGKQTILSWLRMQKYEFTKNSEALDLFDRRQMTGFGIKTNLFSFCPQPSTLCLALVTSIALLSGGCQRPANITSSNTTPVQLETSVDVPLVLAGRYKIKPEKRERFLALAKAGLEPTRQEPGNISYNFYEDPNLPNSFIYFEEWQSREALAQHLQQPYITPLLNEFSELVDGKADVRVYDIKSLTYGLMTND